MKSQYPIPSASDKDGATFVAFDTERGTGLGAPHLLEIGAVRVTDGEVEETFQELVCPQVPVDPACTLIHGITDEDVRMARPAAAVVSAFFDWIGDAPLIAHNARADAHVLGFESARNGLTPPDNYILDTLPLARKALPDAPDYQLETLAEYLEIDVDNIHRALPDAVLCWQVFEKCAERMGPSASLGFAISSTSLANSLPPKPTRRPAQLRKLEAARTEKASVTLTYGGNSESPVRLEVVPRLLFRQKDKSYLEGESTRSGELKTYRLDRIHRIDR